MKHNVFAHNEDQQPEYWAETCVYPNQLRDAEKPFLQALNVVAAELRLSGVDLERPYTLKLSMREVN